MAKSGKLLNGCTAREFQRSKSAILRTLLRRMGTSTTVQVWTYGYLLKRIGEVAEEYGITAIYVDEAYTSSKCPLHGESCGRRIERGLFKCKKLNKVFNADLVAACNILCLLYTSDAADE